MLSRAKEDASKLAAVRKASPAKAFFTHVSGASIVYKSIKVLFVADTKPTPCGDNVFHMPAGSDGSEQIFLFYKNAHARLVQA